MARSAGLGLLDLLRRLAELLPDPLVALLPCLPEPRDVLVDPGARLRQGHAHPLRLVACSCLDLCGLRLGSGLQLRGLGPGLLQQLLGVRLHLLERRAGRGQQSIGLRTGDSLGAYGLVPGLRMQLVGLRACLGQQLLGFFLSVELRLLGLVPGLRPQLPGVLLGDGLHLLALVAGLRQQLVGLGHCDGLHLLGLVPDHRQ